MKGFPPGYPRHTAKNRLVSPGLLFWIGFWLAVLAGGCQGGETAEAAPAPSVTPSTVASLTVAASPVGRVTPVATPTVISSPAPSPTPTPKFAYPQAAQRHRITVTYAPLWQRMTVTQHLTWQNTTGERVERLPLLAPMLTQSYVSLQKVQAANRQAYYAWDMERWVLWLTLAPALEPGDTLELELDYVLTLRPLRTEPSDITKPMVQGYTVLQTNAAEWHFIVAAYHAEKGWLLPRPWPFGEFIPYPIADYTVYVNVPPGWQLAHNGRQIPCPEEEPPFDLCFEVLAARQAVFSTSTVYETFSEEAPSRRGIPVRIEAHVFAGDKDLGPVVVEAMRQALVLYENLYGPYHRERLVFVVGDFPFSMEYDGIFFVRRSFFFDEPWGRLTAITVHEVAHQWWYAQVHNDPAVAPWMDEGLCAFSEILYYQRHLPQRMDWWWGSRWEGLQPNDDPIDLPLWTYLNYFDYRRRAYLNTARMWLDVYETLGESAFSQMMHDYVATYRGRIAYPEDLKALLADSLPQATWQTLQQTYFSSP